MYLRLIPFISLLGFIFFLLPTPIHSENVTVPPSIPGQIVATYVVTNTQDSGPGTFRQAILDLNAGPEPSSISFDIPTTDPGFVGYQDDNMVGTYDPDLPIVPVSSGHDPDGPLWWQIKVESDLPAITKNGSKIDGSSQRFHHGDMNSFGPEIELIANTGIKFGLEITSNFNIIQELTVNNFFAFNVNFNGDNNHLHGCYISIEPGGARSTAHLISSLRALRISGDGNILGGYSQIDRNLISGRAESGIFIEGNNNKILGNYLGVNRQATEVVGGSLNIIHIWSGGNTLIAYNLIGGGAITMEFASGANTNIHDNIIGTDPSGLLDLAGVTDFGAIYIATSDNTIGPSNIIKNHKWGVTVHSNFASRNTITKNAISNNEFEGIDLINGGNNNLQSPTITSIGAGSVSGLASQHAIIEIYSDPDDEGLEYEGTTQADNQGRFTWYGFPQGPYVTATATDIEGNTSEFSEPYPAFSIWMPIVLK